MNLDPKERGTGNNHAPERKLSALRSQMNIEPERLSRTIAQSIQNRVRDLEREGVILGLSGGLDSAVTAAMCARAVGPERTLALVMPDRDSGKEHVRNAVDFARDLHIETKLIDITPLLKKLGVYRLFFLNKLPLPKRLKESVAKKAHRYYESKTGETPFSASLRGTSEKELSTYLKNCNAYYRVKHRLRMVLLYLHGERLNSLVVGAANKSEYRIGFFVKHGCDDAADLMPLLNLFKTQVGELARFLGVPSEILEKAPSPDLIPGITDTVAIGIPYEKLDLILLAMENGWAPRDIAMALSVTVETVMQVREMVEKSAHMRAPGA
jgi:NAD+ synthase